VLLKSRELGCNYLVNNQKPEGNFNYEYDFVAQTQSKEDNEVRQAGALWGVALCHQFAPTDKTRAALDKGLEFFFRSEWSGPDGAVGFSYLGRNDVETGAVALVALALIEYLRSDATLTPARREELDRHLLGYLNFIKAVQTPAGDFSFAAKRGLAERIGEPTPYYDGESQLALAKAAKYLHKTEYLPILIKAAARTAPKYTIEAWRKKADSEMTKGFYQWGSMAFWEYQDAGWEKAKAYADTVMALAWWQIYTHQILNKPANTGYAYEGLINAWRLAVAQHDERAAGELGRAIDKGLCKLTSWQVEGPLLEQNSFLVEHRTTDPLAIGGIMNQRDKPPLRIDVGQHQMHSVMLALEFVYPE